MNFLAHAFLSGNHPKVLVGNFAGDFIKGRQALAEYDPAVAKGVLLHRAIDEYTDQHEIVRESKNRLRTKYRHYAGVIVDMFYDHYLAVHWRNFHPRPLADFITDVYNTLEAHRSILPPRFVLVLSYMVRGNWLLQYREVKGIHQALTGMASRTAYPSGMETATDDLKKYYTEFESEFLRFFPDLIAFADDWRDGYRES